VNGHNPKHKISPAGMTLGRAMEIATDVYIRTSMKPFVDFTAEILVTAHDHVPSTHGPGHSMSADERQEIRRLLADGVSIRKVALIVGVSDRTVARYRRAS
jgi:DNA-binding NarL/FixJ family response regulator